MNTSNDKSIIYFNTRDELIRLDLQRVVYFRADRNYTEAYLLNGARVILPTSVGNLADLLDSPTFKGKVQPFIRIGRSYIIAASQIFHIDVLRQKLVLTNGDSSSVFTIDVPKEALKKLKELYANK